jgi:hypothetical protein
VPASATAELALNALVLAPMTVAPVFTVVAPV